MTLFVITARHVAGQDMVMHPIEAPGDILDEARQERNIPVRTAI